MHTHTGATGTRTQRGDLYLNFRNFIFLKFAELIYFELIDYQANYQTKIKIINIIYENQNIIHPVVIVFEYSSWTRL